VFCSIVHDIVRVFLVLYDACCCCFDRLTGAAVFGAVCRLIPPAPLEFAVRSPPLTASSSSVGSCQVRARQRALAHAHPCAHRRSAAQTAAVSRPPDLTAAVHSTRPGRADRFAFTRSCVHVDDRMGCSRSVLLAVAPHSDRTRCCCSAVTPLSQSPPARPPSLSLHSARPV